MTTVLPLLPDLLPLPLVPDAPGCGVLKSRDGTVLPLRSVDLEVTVSGLFAASRLCQRFENTGTDALEATYIFPLPSRAAVTSFVAHLGGRRIEGRLEERGKAREEYDAAIAAGQRAALAEEDRPEVFTITVGNVLPGEEAVVELLLTQPLAVEEQSATFRFPFVVAPRYVPGTPVDGDQVGDGEALDTDAVPDASRVTPPRLSELDARPDLSVSVTFDDALPYSNICSSLHAVQEDRPTDGSLRLTIHPGDRLDRDLVLRFDVPVSELVSSGLVVRDETPQDVETDGDATWSLTLLPPPAQRTPRDVVVVLDRSGSMGGWKMVAARRAAARIVDTLDLSDRFCVLGFDNVVEVAPSLEESLVEASDRNRFTAVSWLSSLEHRGGTEMVKPLERAAHLLSDPARERTLVLVTDGQVANEDQIVRSFANRGIRVFCVGIDRAVNAGLLQRLSASTGGLCYLVESEDRLDEALRSISRTVGTPSLLDVSVSPRGFSFVEGTASPSDSPDAFAGIPLVLSGRARSVTESAVLVVSARTPTGEPFQLEVPVVSSESPAVTAVWARSRVRDLEDRVAASSRWDAGDDDLVAGVVRHSLRFGVLSRFTAYVAVDAEETGADSMRRVTQPVESPSGWLSPSAKGGAFAGAMLRSSGGVRSFAAAAAGPSLLSNSVVDSAAMPEAFTFAGLPPTAFPTPPAPPSIRSLLELAEEVRDALAAADHLALDALLVEMEANPVVLGDPQGGMLVEALRQYLAGTLDARSRLEGVLVVLLPPASASRGSSPRVGRRSEPFWRQ